MKLWSFVLTFILVGFFSFISLNAEHFAACVAWIVIPMVAGFFLKLTGVPDIKELGWGILYGSLLVFLLIIIFLVYLIATWKMTRLF